MQNDSKIKFAYHLSILKNYWKQFEGFDEKMTHLEVSPKIEAIEAASNKAWNATRTREIKEQRLEDAYDLLKTDLEGENPAEAVLFFAESNAGTFGGSIGQARRAAIDQIVSLTEAGLIKRDVIEKLKTQECSELFQRFWGVLKVI